MSKLQPNQIKHLWLETELTRTIRGKEYQPHGYFLSEKAIERRFKVSFLTARKSLASMEQKGLIYRVPRKGTFVAPRRRSGTILVTFAPTFDLTGVSLAWWRLNELTFVMKLLNQDNPSLEFEPHFVSGKEGVLERFKDLRHHYPDAAGVLFFRDIDLLEKARPYLQKAELPYLFYGSTAHLHRLKDMPRYLYDEDGVARIAIDHLRSLGYDSLGIIYNEESLVHRYRYERALSYCREKNVRVEEGFVINANLATVAEVILSRLEKRGRKKNRPLALWATDDHYLPDLLQTLLANGWKVPQDVVLLGVNNMTYCDVFKPGISSIEIPLIEDAEKSFQALSDLIIGKRKTVDERSHIKLIPRASTISTALQIA